MQTRPCKSLKWSNEPPSCHQLLLSHNLRAGTSPVYFTSSPSSTSSDVSSALPRPNSPNSCPHTAQSWLRVCVCAAGLMMSFLHMIHNISNDSLLRSRQESRHGMEGFPASRPEPEHQELPTRTGQWDVLSHVTSFLFMIITYCNCSTQSLIVCSELNNCKEWVIKWVSEWVNNK